MSQDHSHSHGTENISDNALLRAIILNVGLSAFEFVGGAIAGSGALMADALHNTNDAAALLIAYIARKISRKSADRAYTFGYRRAELIGAMIQLAFLPPQSGRGPLAGNYELFQHNLGRFTS